MIDSISCEHPRIILNPLFESNVQQFGNFYLFGKRYEGRVVSLDFVFHRTGKFINKDNMDSCYVLTYDGRHEPVFLRVGCGHCILCKERKANSFVQRCMCETQMYKYKPIFLTLTYEKKPECGVCLRDTQLFFKRLRVNLERSGYIEPIRYVLVGEYGKNTRRPHYHAVIWNLRQSDFSSYRRIKKIIESSWNKGFIRIRQVQPSDDKAFRYTAKYLRKDCVVPSGCKPCFMVCSNRHGGIGSAFYKSERSKLTKGSYPREFLARNRFSKKPFKYQLDSYALNQMLPTVSRSVPVRSVVRRFVKNYNSLVSYSSEYKCYDSIFDRFFNYYSKFFFVPGRCSSVPFDPGFDPVSAVCELERDLMTLERDIRFCSDDREFSLEYSLNRQRYLDYILRYPPKYNISFRSYRTRRIRQFASQREVL